MCKNVQNRAFFGMFFNSYCNTKQSIARTMWYMLPMVWLPLVPLWYTCTMVVRTYPVCVVLASTHGR
jgi:hypothetical protein